MERVTYLDGLRGVAILLVVFFHAFARYPELVPYSDQFGNFVIFKDGWLGVQLFFLISGFVIFMSLERCPNFFIFIYKRWFRLFPAMLVGTVLIYGTAGFLNERPAGMPNIKDILPGLIFTEPLWLNNIFDSKFSSLEGAFWSLYVEFKFYIIFGFIYYICKKNGLTAITILILLYFGLVVSSKFKLHSLVTIGEGLSINYFLWFAYGAFAYKYFVNNTLYFFLCTVLVGLCALGSANLDYDSFYYGLTILFLFLAPLFLPCTRFLFSNKIFMFIGFISYPFYLIHENSMML